MKRKKKKTRRGNFLKRVQSSSKVRSVRDRIRKKKAELKKLSGEYRRAIRSVSKKMS